MPPPAPPPLEFVQIVLLFTVADADTSTYIAPPLSAMLELVTKAQRLTLTGTGLPDTLGRFLDGNADGQPGGDYTVELTKRGPR